MAPDISFSYPAYPCNPGECLNGIHTVDLANPGSDKVGYGNPHHRRQFKKRFLYFSTKGALIREIRESETPQQNSLCLLNSHSTMAA